VTKPAQRNYTQLALKTGYEQGLDAHEVRRVAHRHHDRSARDFVFTLGSINIYAVELKSTSGFEMTWHYAWSLPKQRIEFFLNVETEMALRSLLRRKEQGRQARA